jgi:hypothetical protein
VLRRGEKIRDDAHAPGCCGAQTMSIRPATKPVKGDTNTLSKGSIRLAWPGHSLEESRNAENPKCRKGTQF